MIACSTPRLSQHYLHNTFFYDSYTCTWNSQSVKLIFNRMWVQFVVYSLVMFLTSKSIHIQLCGIKNRIRSESPTSHFHSAAPHHCLFVCVFVQCVDASSIASFVTHTIRRMSVTGAQQTINSADFGSQRRVTETPCANHMQRHIYEFHVSSKSSTLVIFIFISIVDNRSKSS